MSFLVLKGAVGAAFDFEIPKAGHGSCAHTGSHKRSKQLKPETMEALKVSRQSKAIHGGAKNSNF